MLKQEKEIASTSKIIIQNYNSNNSRNLKRLIKNKPINILVESIETINDFEILKYFLFCSIGIRLGEIFFSLSYENKILIIKNSNNKLIKDIFDDIEIDDIFEFMNQLSKNDFKKIILNISPNIRKKLTKLSIYDEGEVGSIMNSSLVKLDGELTISKAVKIIENNKDDIELNGILFVTNLNDELIGQVNIYDILLEKKRSLKIKKIMNKNFLSINNKEDIENLTNLFQKYELRIIPVVNNENILLGYINDSDIISLIQEENTDDIYKMYGINELDKPYSRTRVLDIVKSRVVWLLLLMIFSTFTSMVLTSLQDWSETSLRIDAAITTLILVPIIPVISGTAGNAGSQSSATIIRSLSIGEMKTKDYKKILYKEFVVSLIIGLILSIINFLRLILYFFAIKSKLQDIKLTIFTIEQFIVIISAGISLSLFLAIILSKVVGSFLPIIAVKLKIDPASMASPLLTTIIDTITISILFLIGIGVLYSLLSS